MKVHRERSIRGHQNTHTCPLFHLVLPLVLAAPANSSRFLPFHVRPRRPRDQDKGHGSTWAEEEEEGKAADRGNGVGDRMMNPSVVNRTPTMAPSSSEPLHMSHGDAPIDGPGSPRTTPLGGGGGGGGGSGSYLTDEDEYLLHPMAAAAAAAAATSFASSAAPPRTATPRRIRSPSRQPKVFPWTCRRKHVRGTANKRRPRCPRVCRPPPDGSARDEPGQRVDERGGGSLSRCREEGEPFRCRSDAADGETGSCGCPDRRGGADDGAGGSADDAVAEGRVGAVRCKPGRGGVSSAPGVIAPSLATWPEEEAADGLMHGSLLWQECGFGRQAELTSEGDLRGIADACAPVSWRGRQANMFPWKGIGHLRQLGVLFCGFSGTSLGHLSLAHCRLPAHCALAVRSRPQRYWIACGGSCPSQRRLLHRERDRPPPAGSTRCRGTR